MATKIVLKHGTGAPLASDLEVGEVGIDLAGGLMYTKNGSNDVILVGGTGPGGTVVNWDEVLNKPDSFPPESHVHSTDQITGLDTKLAEIDAELLNLDSLIDATLDQLAFGGTWNASTGKIDHAVKQGLVDGQSLPDASGFPSTFLICIASGNQPVAMTEGDWLVSDGIQWHPVLYETAGGVAWDNVLDKPTEFPPEAHTHTTAQVTGLDTALAGKADATHSHVIADVTGLQDELDKKIDADGGYIYGGTY